jgi:hypothetical protein
MSEKCCAEMQACDQDPDCLYCMVTPTDTSERCVDQETFVVRHSAWRDCQKDNCLSACGVGSNSFGPCSEGACSPSCSNYGDGCR